MKHKEQTLQIQCVRWLRYEYPWLARLLTHPINEGSRNSRVTGAIHKAEGTVAGVADLLLFLPAVIDGEIFHGLGIEMKEKSGYQSQEQKDFERMFVAAGFAYALVRSFEQFKSVINGWVANCPSGVLARVKAAHKQVEMEADQRAYEKFKNIIKPRK